MKLLVCSILLFFYSYGTAQGLAAGEVLISEVLFNPRAGGVDFVELYNLSGRSLDLRELYIGSVDPERRISNVLPLSTGRVLFHPDSYLAFTTRPDIVQEHYPAAAIGSLMGVAKLPNFNNDEGTVIVLYRPAFVPGGADDWVIDSLHYHASMHSTFLKDVKGISLERRDMRTGTNVAGNFGSAALTVGGATPGHSNSSAESPETTIRMRSRIVSPDHDGVHDELELQYAFRQDNLMATLRIYDARGRSVRTLIGHQSIPTQGVWKWDGTDDRGQPVREGIHTIFIELYDAQGYRRVYRKSFVVARRN